MGWGLAGPARFFPLAARGESRRGSFAGPMASHTGPHRLTCLAGLPRFACPPRPQSQINRPNDSDFDLPVSRERPRGVIRPLAGARGDRKVQSAKDVGLMVSLRAIHGPPFLISALRLWWPITLDFGKGVHDRELDRTRRHFFGRRHGPGRRVGGNGGDSAEVVPPAFWVRLPEPAAGPRSGAGPALIVSRGRSARRRTGTVGRGRRGDRSGCGRSGRSARASSP